MKIDMKGPELDWQLLAHLHEITYKKFKNNERLINWRPELQCHEKLTENW